MLNQQYKLISSILGISMQTAIYIIIATKGFDTFDNWRQLACYADVETFPYQPKISIKGRTKALHYLTNVPEKQTIIAGQRQR